MPSLIETRTCCGGEAPGEMQIGTEFIRTVLVVKIFLNMVDWSSIKIGAVEIESNNSASQPQGV